MLLIIFSVALVVMGLWKQQRLILFTMRRPFWKTFPLIQFRLLMRKKLVLISNEDIKKMKVDLWKTELYKRGIFTSGNEAEILEKLRNYKRNRIPLASEATTSVVPPGNDVRARWRLLSNTTYQHQHLPRSRLKIKEKSFYFSVACGI